MADVTSVDAEHAREPAPAGRLQVFVSYARRDLDRVLPEIEWLQQTSLDVWYDKQIEPGTQWADELAKAIDSSAFVLYFVTEKSIDSTHCLNEIAYSVDAGKPVLAVYFEPVELRGGLRLSMSRTHAILRWQLKEEEYRGQLKQALRKIGDLLTGASTPDSVAAYGPAKTFQNIWQVPMHRNFYFGGREKELQKIRAEFQNSGHPMVLALTGLGGIGKSQLALEYVYRHATDFRVVAWLRAETTASAEADIARLAVSLGLEQAGEANMTVVAEAVYAWLETSDSWFLVLDNVGDPEALRRLLPHKLRGHVLVTTRYDGRQSNARSLAINPFDFDAAADYVMSRSGDSDKASALAIARHLGGLPLALEEACAYMENTGRSIAGYLDLFESHHRELMKRSVSRNDYPATLQTTWEVSFLELEKVEPSAIELLKLLAYLGPDDIPESLLLNCKAFAGAESPAQFELDNAISALKRYSLIAVGREAVSVHRLVQLVTRDRLNAAEQRSSALQALVLVDKAFPVSGAVGDQLPDCGRLLPHAAAVLQHTTGDDDAAVIAGRLLGRTGTYLAARGAVKEGIAHLEKAYRLFERLAANSADFAHACELYGRVKYQCGDLPQARRLLENAVAILDDIGDETGLLHPHCLAVLGWICWSAGDREMARAAAERSTRMISRQTSVHDPRTLSGQSVLGRIQMDAGEVQGAIETVDSCIAVIRTLGGIRQPIMCGAFLQMAQVLVYAGLPLRAQSWAQESLDLAVPAYGEHHPLVAGSHCVLGQVLMDIGETEAAVREFEATIESVRRSSTNVSQYSAIAASYSTVALLKLNRQQEARHQLAESDLLVHRKISGDSAMALAHFRIAAAKVAAAEHDVSAATGLCEDAIQGLSASYTKDHPFLAHALLTKAEILADVGDTREAQVLVRQVMETMRASGLAMHPLCAEALRLLAATVRASGDAESARSYEDEALSTLKACAGPSSAATAALEKEFRHA